jgi:hypothetical protein
MIWRLSQCNCKTWSWISKFFLPSIGPILTAMMMSSMNVEDCLDSFWVIYSWQTLWKLSTSSIAKDSFHRLFNQLWESIVHHALEWTTCLHFVTLIECALCCGTYRWLHFVTLVDCACAFQRTNCLHFVTFIDCALCFLTFKLLHFVTSVNCALEHYKLLHLVHCALCFGT